MTEPSPKVLAAKYNECDLCGKKLLTLSGWDFYSGVCLEHEIPRIGRATWGLGAEPGRRESRGLYSSEVNVLTKATLEASTSSTTDALVEIQTQVEHQLQICSAADSQAYVNALNWFLALIREARTKTTSSDDA